MVNESFTEMANLPVVEYQSHELAEVVISRKSSGDDVTFSYVFNGDYSRAFAVSVDVANFTVFPDEWHTVRVGRSRDCRLIYYCRRDWLAEEKSTDDN